MTGVNLYSTTAANNVNANTGVNWDEGMSPASVNNSARQNMADTRAAFNDLVWFRYGKGDGPDTVTYASATSLTVAGVDVTAAYHAGRRIKAVGSGTGTIYGSISSSAFSTNTTINVTWDSGSLTNESLTVYLSQIPVTGSPVAGAAVAPVQGSWTPGDSSGSGLTLATISAGYTRLGNMIFAYASFAYPVTATSNLTSIGGLPFAAPAPLYAGQGILSYCSASGVARVFPNSGASSASFWDANGNQLANSALSGATVHILLIYPLS